MVLLCASCILPDDPARERAKRAERAQGDIVVGAVAPWRDIDIMLWEGIQLGVEEINQRGGISNRKIRLIRRDDQDSVDKGITIAQEFCKNPDLVAVVGHYQSFVTMPASVVYQYNGVFMLCTVDTDPDLTKQGFSLVFRTVPDDMDYGQKLAEFCRLQGFNGMVFFIQQNEYGRDFSDAFAAAATSAGIEILDGESYNQSTTVEEIRKVLRLWKKYFPFDAILLSGQLPQAGVIIREARRLGIEQPIIGGIELDRKPLLKLVGNQVKDVFLPTDFNPHDQKPEVRRFVAAFQKRYGKTPDVLAAQGYDTILCLAYAIQKAGTTSPPKMAEALRLAKKLMGMTGILQFSPTGARVVDDICIKTVENGKFRFMDSQAEVGGQRSEDRGRKSEDGGQRTEDGGRKSGEFHESEHHQK